MGETEGNLFHAEKIKKKQPTKGCVESGIGPRLYWLKVIAVNVHDKLSRVQAQIKFRKSIYHALLCKQKTLFGVGILMLFQKA